jgi:hypothetical protein
MPGFQMLWGQGRSSVGLKFDAYDLAKTVFDNRVDSLHFEIELCDSQHWFSGNLILQYAAVDGVFPLSISASGSPDCDLRRREFSIGIGARSYLVNAIFKPDKPFYNFFIEAQLHYYYLRDSIQSSDFFNYDRVFKYESLPVFFKLGYQLKLFKHIQIEPAITLRPWRISNDYLDHSGVVFHLLLGVVL